ncbi:MAG TPA: hypothetical protein VGG05_08265 [Pseudonocardiaceae bacterium]|jgi:antitoxin component YwqK of YwqJK toxin-antitoxin module
MTTPSRVHIDATTVDEHEDVCYQGVPFTGQVYDTTADGTVVTEKSYRDGREDGSQREWYGDGSPESEYQAEAGAVVGLALDWHRNGRPARRQDFDGYGQLRHREAWDSDGTPQPDQTFDWPAHTGE